MRLSSRSLALASIGVAGAAMLLTAGLIAALVTVHGLPLPFRGW